MVMKFFETELRYIEQFAQRNTHLKGIDFYDDRLPDMYAHNFTFLESINELDEEISRLIDQRKESGRPFLRIETVLPLRDQLLEALPVRPSKQVFDLMAAVPTRFTKIPRREGIRVRRLETEEEFAKLVKVDVLCNREAMGEDFARARIQRKIEVYRTGTVRCYGVFSEGELLGSCEYFINGRICKLEDFDILPEHQRKGLGSTMLSHLMEEAVGEGILHVYLITDQADTAWQMYEKCHFKKVAEKFEWFFAWD